MSFDIQQWYNKQQNDATILAYKGSISSKLIEEILDTIENSLKEANEKSKIRKRIYNVLVEALQNLFHHIDVPPESAGKEFEGNFGMFIFSKSNGIYKVTTGNFVKKQKVKLLKDRMDQINYLSKDELKTLYRLILNNQEFTDKGGGGLGMIDIAKRTGNKLDYKFYEYNDDYCFFSLDVIIS